MKYRVLLAIALAVGLCSAATIIQRMHLQAAAEPTTPATTHAPTARVVSGLGYVEPVSEVRRLTFAADGVIGEVHVELGQTVPAGKVLMTLENHVEAALVTEAEHSLALAIAERDQLLAGAHPEQVKATEHQLELMTERLEHARREENRVSELANKNAASGQERDRAATEARQAAQARLQVEAELAHLRQVVREQDRQVANAQVELAKSRLELSRQRLKNTVLKAPFSGTVLEILKRQGESVHSSDGQAVLFFADEQRLQVRAEIDDRHVAHLCEGQRAEIYGRGLGTRRYQGTVRVMKHVMGNKTVFSKTAAERKDLDVLQLLIAMPSEFRAPIGLQVDVNVSVAPEATRRNSAPTPSQSSRR